MLSKVLGGLKNAHHSKSGWKNAHHSTSWWQSVDTLEATQSWPDPYTSPLNNFCQPSFYRIFYHRHSTTWTGINRRGIHDLQKFLALNQSQSSNLFHGSRQLKRKYSQYFLWHKIHASWKGNILNTFSGIRFTPAERKYSQYSLLHFL